MQEQDLDILQGSICSVMFQNYDNGYAVLKLNIGKGENITVVGTIPLPVIGEQLMVTGRWITHSSYGKQFEAEFLERLLPESTSGILSFLSSRVIKGIGPRMAARIVEHFGQDTLAVIEREPGKLAEISGISKDRAIKIGEEFQQQMGMRQVMEFFTTHQLPAELAVRCYKIYGDKTIELLYDDPYMLMDKGMDAPFNAVDHFAIELGVSANDPRRIEAGLIFELSFNLSAGHSFLPYEKLSAATAQLLSVEQAEARDGIERLLAAQRVVGDNLAGISVVYLPDLYDAEIFCTNKLIALLTPKQYSADASGHLIQEIVSSAEIQYSPKQVEALKSAVSSDLLIITGGPGTGKTTVLNGILELFRKMKMSCLLAAPTGRAAKRLSEVTGEDASTIHRLLEAGIDQESGLMTFAKCENNPLKCDSVIVDEMSMVDISLLASLLRAIPDGTKLILVGDPDQLPPVGPGFPFGDMIRSGMIPIVRLTEVFRQAQKSLIVMNAHRVNSGITPDLKSVNSDFFFMRRSSEEAVCSLIRDLCTVRLPQRMGIQPSDIQVLSPTRKGLLGTANLNHLLQSALNPAAPTKKEKTYGDYVFREGDRVMQIRNNYDILWKNTNHESIGYGIFNGDIGVIQLINPEIEMMRVLFDDREAEYDFTQLNELEPAYAVTVHKSQGSEYKAVILAAWNGSPYLMTRNILYTGITRARDLLILTGKEDTVVQMTQNISKNKRYTGLKLRLQEYNKC